MGLLVPHDPKWRGEFEALAVVLRAALEGLVDRIEHVGSTAVPDLLAKPILDVDVVLRADADFGEVVRRLDALGYRHVGDQGIAGREVFKAREVAPTSPREGGWMSHHLYVCSPASAELRRHLRLRDVLRRDPRCRREYEAIKLRVAAAAGGDRRRYAELKERECRDFIEAVLARET